MTQKTIAVSPSVHKELAYRKIEKEYGTFEDMIVDEVLED